MANEQQKANYDALYNSVAAGAAPLANKYGIDVALPQQEKATQPAQALPQIQPIQPIPQEQQSGEKVDMVDNTGAVYSVPKENVEYMHQHGFRQPTQEELVKYDAKKKVEQDGLWGRLRLGATNIVDELFLGVPGIVAEHTMTPEQKAYQETLAEENPILNYTTKGIGFVGSFFNPLVAGPLGKGGQLIEKGAAHLATKAEGTAARLAVKAAEAGAKGAMYAAPQAVTEAAFGDFEAAAETMAFGTIGGIALEPIAKGIAKGGSALLDHLIPDADEAAFRSITPSSRTTQSALKKANAAQAGEQKALGRFAREQGVLPGVTESGEEYLANKLKPAITNADTKLDGIYRKFDEAVSPSDLSPSSFMKSVKQKVYDRLSPNVGLEGQALEDYIEAQAKAYRNDLLVKQAANGGEKLTFSDVRSVRQGIDDTINFAADDVTKSKALARRAFRTAINEEMYNITEKLQKDLDPSIANELKTANHTISNLLSIKTLVEDDLVRGVRNNKNGFIANIFGSMAGVASGAIAAAAGSPLLGALVVTPLMRVAATGISRQIETKGWNLIAKLQDNKAVFAGAKSMQKAADEMSVLQRLATGAKLDPKYRALLEVPQFFGDKKQEREDAFQKHLTVMQSLQQDPTVQDGIKYNADQLASQGAPQTATIYAQKQQQIIQYLQDNLPKTKQTRPFSTAPTTPTTKEIKDYEDRVMVALDPIATIITHFEKGTLNNNHIEALKALYPKVYTELQNKITNAGFQSAAKDLPLAKKKMFQLIISGPQSETTPVIQKATYKAEPPAPQKSLPHNTFNPKPYQTESQRLSSK